MLTSIELVNALRQRLPGRSAEGLEEILARCDRAKFASIYEESGGRDAAWIDRAVDFVRATQPNKSAEPDKTV